MGDPEFKLRDLIKRENIRVFSSNYALYGELSRRVSDTLGSMVPTIENYSIDESFLNLGEFAEREVEPLARALRERVHRWVGIPTCVGIAPTKTLAKIANFIAKKRPQYRGVCDMRSSQVRAELLPTVPVDEVWGIGSASAAKLIKIGVRTAADLAALDPDNARALMTVTGGRTVYELRGISCLPLELMEPTRKGIAVTRSFGAPVTYARGIPDELAFVLMQNIYCTVLSPSSTACLAAQGFAVAATMKRLGAQIAFEGSARAEGSRLRITARIVDVMGIQLWVKRVDIEVGPRASFAVEEELAKAVAAGFDVVRGHRLALMDETRSLEGVPAQSSAPDRSHS